MGRNKLGLHLLKPRRQNSKSRKIGRFEQLETRQLLAATLGVNFTASTFGIDSNSIPPDTDGAVGVNHYVELINGRYSVYDKITSARIETKSLDQFWLNAGVAPALITDVFDPRIVFDHASERWFAASVGQRKTAQSNVLIAVSNSTDPTLGWTAFSIDADPTDQRWADYPMLGVDAKGITIGINMFDIEDVGNNEAPNALIVSIPKLDLIQAVPTFTNATVIRDLSFAAIGSSVHPTIDYGIDDGRSTMLSTDSANDEVIRTNVLGAGAAGATLSPPERFKVEAFAEPTDAEQPGPKQNITVEDTRLVAAPFEVGNSIWIAYSVNDAGGRSAIRWQQLNRATGAVEQSNTIRDATLSFYYPSIAANRFGDVVIGFSGSSESQPVSAFVSAGKTVGGVTTFDSPMMTVAGVASYERLDDFTPRRNRWGDYSSTSLDPINDKVFWTIQEFVSAEDQWSTQITQVIIDQPFVLPPLAADAFEPNDSIATATILGSQPETILRNLTIDNPNDQDWFRVTANQTGKTIVNVLFDDVPGDGLGNLELAVFDVNGRQLVSSKTQDSNERIVFPTLAQEDYYIRVYGLNNETNRYTLEIENFVAPVPSNVSLDPSFGGTPYRLGSLSSGFPELFIAVDVRGFVDSNQNGFSDAGEIQILTDVQAMSPTPPAGVAVEVLGNGVSLGFANDVSGNGTLFSFIPNGTFVRVNTTDGSLVGLTAAVRVFDGKSTTLSSGRGILSEPLNVILDEAAKLGVWSGGSVYLDLNGNSKFDSDTALDAAFILGFATDHVFSGQFNFGTDRITNTADDGDGANGNFDRLAAYGRVGGNFRWLIDFTNDGAPDERVFNEPAGFQGVGIPLAGNFDPVAANGDEIGLFTGTEWIFDRNRNFRLADDARIKSNMRGLPIVADLDADGVDDVGTYDAINNKLFVSLSSEGGGVNQPVINTTHTFLIANGHAFIGTRERPVAGDINDDGSEEFGLFVPDRSGLTPSEGAEWYFFASPSLGGLPGSIDENLPANTDVIEFRPRPFGGDLFFQFGDEYSLPLVGNFDPPGQSASTSTNSSSNNQNVTTTSTQTTTVVPQNTAPFVSSPLGTTVVLEDSAATNVDLHAVFSDTDALTFQVLSNSQASIVNATVVDGVLRLTPVRDASGEAQVMVQARDSLGAVAVDVITVRVTPMNDAPVSITPVKTYRIDEDSPTLSLGLAGFFADADGDQLTFTILELGEQPSIVEATMRDGILLLTPKTDRNGIASLQLIATDPSGASTTSAIQVDVAPINDAPIVTQPFRRVEIFEDGSKYCLAVDDYFRDVDSDSLIFSVSSSGTANLIDVTLEDGKATVTPQPNQSGQATVSVQATDREGASTSASFDVIVLPVNDAPIAAAPSVLSVFTDEVITPISLTSLFTDIDDNQLQYRLVPGQDESIVTALIANNQLSLDVSGRVAGSTRIQVEARDSGGLTAIHEVRLTTVIRNTPPTINQSAVLSSITLGSTPQSFDLNTWFSDSDSQTLRYSVASSASAHATFQISGQVLIATPITNDRNSGTISITATDSEGATATTSIPYEVIPPVVSPVIATTPPATTTSSTDPVVVEVQPVAQEPLLIVPEVQTTSVSPAVTPPAVVPPVSSSSTMNPTIPTPPAVTVSYPPATVATTPPAVEATQPATAAPPKFSFRAFLAR